MGHNYGGEPRLVMRAGGVGWVNGLVVGLLVLFVVLVAGLTITGTLPLGYAMLSCCGILVAPVLLWAIVPRSYEVYDDRLVIVFGPGRWNIGIDSIEEVRAAKTWYAYGYKGMRFATAPSKSVEVRRRNSNVFLRPNLIISPDDRELFLVEMNTVLSRYQRARLKI